MTREQWIERARAARRMQGATWSRQAMEIIETFVEGAGDDCDKLEAADVARRCKLGGGNRSDAAAVPGRRLTEAGDAQA